MASATRVSASAISWATSSGSNSASVVLRRRTPRWTCHQTSSGSGISAPIRPVRNDVRCPQFEVEREADLVQARVWRSPEADPGLHGAAAGPAKAALSISVALQLGCDDGDDQRVERHLRLGQRGHRHIEDQTCRAGVAVARHTAKRGRMKAARYDDDGVRVLDVPEPEPGRDEALVHISAAGVCHSDVHIRGVNS